MILISTISIAMISEAFSQVLHFLPVETRPKAEQVYARAPGTLMKFLNTNTVQKKVECRNKFIVDGKLNLPNESKNYNDNTCNEDVYDEKNKIPKSPDSCKAISYKPMESSKSQSSPERRPMQNKSDHHIWDDFRTHFLDSLRKAFHERSITEINSNEIGNLIFDRCQEQCLNADKYHKASSLPIRFEKCYPVMNAFGRMNTVVCYVDAYIVCQSTKTWTHKYQTEMTYDATIEVHALSQDYEKLERLREIIMNNDVPTIIEMIEEKSKLTWEGFVKKK